MEAQPFAFGTQLTDRRKWEAYLAALKTNFTKLARLDFLQGDDTVAFSVGSQSSKMSTRPPYGGAALRSAAFLQEGTLNVSLQNGQRRRGSVKFSNLDACFNYNVNNIWFGQRVRLMMGLVLPNGTEYYLPQGVFYIANPQDVFMPGERTATFELLDKWAYLDGTLFGNLDGIYQVALNENIFTAISSVLAFDRGNGEAVDGTAPLFTERYNGKTVTLPDGRVLPVTNTPYTYRCESESGTLSDVVIELNKMLAGWIGYDATGRLRLEASDEDILDTDKPVLWSFTPEESEFLGASYKLKNTEVYNDIIISGESLGNSPIAKGRAVNDDPSSDTNIRGRLGRRVKRMSAPGYYADAQCKELAEWYLKRFTVLKKSVTISSTQMFHLNENNIVTIRRTDKPGRPTERHLLTGFSLPIGQSGAMTLEATSVQDFPVATIS
ncbi:MAG: hypothetical protein RR235_08885 [Oscillospiraceae bacterium]